MNQIKQDLEVDQYPKETTGKTLARTITSPEILSASILTICQSSNHSHISEMIGELKQQSAAIHADDLSRVERMLIAQAHTLDGLFAKLTSQALTSGHMDKMECYMKLALKAQSQARATLQTLSELKMPRQIAFVKQANIGNQVQVNNESMAASESKPARTRKNRKAPNGLLEEQGGKWLDTRAASSAGSIDPAMEAVGAEFGAYYHGR